MPPSRGSFFYRAHDLPHVIFLYLVATYLTERSNRTQGFNLLDHGKITFIDALQSGLGLRKNGIREVEDMLLKKIKEIETSNNGILLVLDGIDFLLSATEARLDEVLGMIWELREVCHQSLYWSIYTTSSTLMGSLARPYKYSLHVDRLSPPPSPTYFARDRRCSCLDESSTSSQSHMGH